MILGLTGLIAGFAIAFEYFLQWEPRLSKLSGMIEKYAKYLGALSLFVGIWKFFGPDLSVSTSAGYIQSSLTLVPAFQQEPFIGDFFPSVFLIAGGASLTPQFFQFFNIRQEVKEKLLSTLKKFKLLLGPGNMILGLVHLLIPGSSFF